MNYIVDSMKKSDCADFGDHYLLSPMAENHYTFKLSCYHWFFVIVVILGVGLGWVRLSVPEL